MAHTAGAVVGLVAPDNQLAKDSRHSLWKYLTSLNETMVKPALNKVMLMANVS